MILIDFALSICITTCRPIGCVLVFSYLSQWLQDQRYNVLCLESRKKHAYTRDKFTHVELSHATKPVLQKKRIPFWSMFTHYINNSSGQYIGKDVSNSMFH